jgi:hypothetical protein
VLGRLRRKACRYQVEQLAGFLDRENLEGELESLRFDYLEGSVWKYLYDQPLRLSKLLWRLSVRFRQLVWPLRHEHSVDDRETDVVPSGRFRNCNKTADSGNTV